MFTTHGILAAHGIFTEHTLATAQSIVTFILVLAVLIFVHELGHFLVARWCGVRVLTFALGFGPTLFSRTHGDTEYALKAIPLGGYVKMFGEEADEELSEADRRRTFSGKTVWQRMAIVFAGPLFNMITALLIFCGVFAWGVPVAVSQVGDVQKDSAAAQAGFHEGDLITAMNGVPVSDWDEVRAHVQGGAPISVTVQRDGHEMALSVTPRQAEARNIFGEPVTVWQIGISARGTTITRHYNPVQAVAMGVERTWEVTHLTVLGIVKLIQRTIPSDTIGGPILIAQMAGQQAHEGFMNVVLFVALLSINLGILNLLPIPVLDGGHLLFLVVEAVLGRPVNVRVREVAQQAGLFLLLALMAFAFYNDIMRLFTKG